jgi:hypothetical protein
MPDTAETQPASLTESPLIEPVDEPPAAAVMKPAGKLTDRQADTMTSKQAFKLTDKQVGNRTSKQADNRSGSGGDPKAGKVKGNPVNAESAHVGLLEARIGAAEELAKSSSITVTVRIPRALNEWLDAYVHGSWPERVLKQGLVVEALRLLYARRGRPGEQVLETELLKDAEP